MRSLKKYNLKRDFTKTKEPVGKVSKSSKKLKFVVQHHLARKDHYDLRLEWNGTMKSWAVPKGPSYNSQDKRLAVLVEDHPLSYRNFEGTIPKGEYGAGVVMLWDEGTWEPLEPLPKNFKVSSFKFVLKGQRLQGKWTLIKMQDNNWLLIKENDNIYLFDDIKVFERSIRTNRTMEEIKENKEVIKAKTSLKNHIIDGITITNSDKVIFKELGITKQDIAYYYHLASKRMLPFIKGRLFSTIRCPNGLGQEEFFMKHFNPINEGVKKILVKNAKNIKEDYYYIDSVSGIISEVQMNSYEFHILGSRVETLENPDIMVFDLDPDKSISMETLKEGVRDLKSILDKLNLKAYLKVSGQKGYHILVPIKKKMSWLEFRNTSKNIVKLMEATWPNKYTSNIRKNKRKKKIFIDWVRNTRFSTSVAPYSIRLKENCPVSFPISWRELDKVNPSDITLSEAIKRLKRKDPWADFYK